MEVKYILDPKDFSDHPAAKLFIKNFDAILEDPEVKVVVETIGGTRFAYPYVKACLESGRSVCTSNKEMVATYGAELLALAKAHNCAFLFEASVGGGTPIITPMHQCLAANVITEVEGIVNGTTNFMLTKMVRENLGFDEALKSLRSWATPRRRIPATMWTAATPAARSPSCPRWSAATRSTPRTSPPAASATSRWMMWLRQRSWAASSSSSPG